MDKKLKVDASARKAEPKRRLSKWEAERRRRNLVLAVISLTIVAAVGIIAYGYYATRVRPWHQPIVRVNDTVFDMEYFVGMLRLWGVGQNPSAGVETAQQRAAEMISNELMRQGAAELFGLAVSREAIEGEIREIFGLEVTDADFEQKYRDALKNLAEMGLSQADFHRLYADSLSEPQWLRSQLLARFGEERYPSDGLVPHVHIQAMLVTGSDNATAVKARWSEGITQLSAAFPDARFYPTKEAVEWLPKGIESTAFDDYAFGDASRTENLGLISDPIEDSDESGKLWVIQVLGAEDRPLSEDDRNELTSQALNEWLENEKKPEVNEVVNYLEGGDGYRKIYWALDHV
ncbi:MAG: hypothetical protein FJ020_00230 [Chloroflexi bacterium]|nr:hypothetical protein [Chloroflexota bacterium]